MGGKNKFLTFSNGLKMPSIGLGTLGGNKDDLEKALDLALEAGYRHIDTAFVYQNEEVIGKVLQKWFKSGKLKREDVFITTKLPGASIHVEQFIKKSLANLQLDYLDLYLIHLPFGFKYEEESGLPKRDANGAVITEPKTDHAAIWKKMEEQVDLGRTKSIGLSNYNISQIQTVLNTARIKPANLQVELHVFLQQRELVQFCHKNGITVVAYSPLGAPNYNERMRKIAPNKPETPLPNMLGNSTINKIAQKHSKSAAQIMLKFLLQMGVAPIPKSTTPQRIRDNFDVFGFTLDDEDVQLMTNLEVGEEARVAKFYGFENHPDYPLKR